VPSKKLGGGGQLSPVFAAPAKETLHRSSLTED